MSPRKGGNTFSGGQWWNGRDGGPPRTHLGSFADPGLAACGTKATTYPIYIADKSEDISCKRCLKLKEKAAAACR